MLSKVSDSTLFDHLDTTWEFKSGPTPSTTWLNFSIDFAFKSPLYRHIAGVFFDEVSSSGFLRPSNSSTSQYPTSKRPAFCSPYSSFSTL